MANLCARAVLITGASRGLGLEFVKQLVRLPEAPKHIFATCRNPTGTTELNELAAANPSVHVYKFDALDYSAYPELVKSVEQKLNGEGLNLLINNAGQYQKAADIDNVTRDMMVSDYELNAVVPLLLSKAFMPLLKKAASFSNLAGLSCSKAAIINITSKMGSIDDNTSGGSYSYRASKTAQNMVSKSLSVDLKPHDIMVLALHPGWVLTDMGGKNALIDTETSVGGMLKVMCEQKGEDTGKFITYQGILVPW